MAGNRYYIVSEDQANILLSFGISIYELGDLLGVDQDSDTIMGIVMEAIFEDDEISPEEDEALDILGEGTWAEIFWSTEAHLWTPQI